MNRADIRRLEAIGRQNYPELWAHADAIKRPPSVRAQRWMRIGKSIGHGITQILSGFIVMVMVGIAVFLVAKPFLPTMIRFAETSAPAAAPVGAPYPPDTLNPRKEKQ